MKLDVIQVTTDLSDHSLSVVPYAVSLAIEHNARLLLAHVVPMPDEVPRATSRLKDHLASIPLDKSEVVVEVGPVVPRLIEVAAQRSAGLIVVASHGRTGLARAIMGSTACGLVQGAPCPVAVLKSGVELLPPEPVPEMPIEEPLVLRTTPLTDEDRFFARLDAERLQAMRRERDRMRDMSHFRVPLDTLVVGVDFSDESVAAVALAKSLLGARDGRVKLLHVVTAAGMREEQEAAVAVAWEKLEALAAGDRRIDWEVTRTSGSIANTLVVRGRKLMGDVILTGTRGLRGVPRLLLGSTAEGVMRLSNGPVISMRAGIPAVVNLRR